MLSGGLAERVRLALEAGAQPNCTDEAEKTALMVASQNGFAEVVQVLLAAGADPELPAKDGRTALMLASQFGHDEVVHVLLDWGANMDKQDGNGRTALLLAAHHAQTGIVQILLEKGEGTSTKTSDGGGEWSEINWQFTTNLRKHKRTQEEREQVWMPAVSQPAGSEKCRHIICVPLLHPSPD